MNRFLAIALFALSFTSCQNASERDTATEATATDSPGTLVAPTATTNTGLTPVPNISAVPTTTPALVSGATPAGGLNPAHGQPGHRCDIAVGAPLSTPVSNTPTATATPAMGSAPSMMATPAQTPVAAPTGVGSGKLNPAHGQPGHDCSVPVGAPLKS